MTRIDSDAAEALPGVLLILTHQSAARLVDIEDAEVFVVLVMATVFDLRARISTRRHRTFTPPPTRRTSATPCHGRVPRTFALRQPEECRRDAGGLRDTVQSAAEA